MNDHDDHNDVHQALDALRDELIRQHHVMQSSLLGLELHAQLALDALNARESDPQGARQHLESLLDFLPTLRADLEGRRQPQREHNLLPVPAESLSEWSEGVVLGFKLHIELERAPRENLLLQALSEVAPGLGDAVANTSRLRGFCALLQEQLMERPTKRRSSDA